MPSFTPAKALLVALLAASGLAAQAQAPAKKGGDDTSQQIAAGIELEMTAMMAGMVDTCKLSVPARAQELDTAWAEGLKTASPQIIAYAQTAEFTAKRKQYHEEQRAEAAKPGQAQKLEEQCGRLLK